MTIKPLTQNRQIVVSNKINEARFKMSRAEQKLFLFFIGVVDNSENTLDTPFKMNVTEFTNYLELKRKDLHKSMQETTREFASRVIEFRNEQGELIQMPVLSKVHYKKGFVEIKVNSELKPYLIDLKNQFTKFSLSEVLSFKSLYSMRIYQILSQWIYKGKVEYSVEELRFMLDVKDIEYTRYNDFKRKVLEVAHKEINKSSSLKFSYKEVKTGRKVTSIAFTIKQVKDTKSEQIEELIPAKQTQTETKQEKESDVNFVIVGEMQKMEDSETVKRLVALGLSRQNSQKIIEECGDDYTIFALEKSKIETRTNVDNKAGYFTSIIGTYKEIYRDERQREEEQKEQVRIGKEQQELREKEEKEKQEKFDQEQEELSRSILEEDPELFCKKVFDFMDTFIGINWGFHNHPEFHENRRNGKKEENMRIAKEIRSRFRACSSLRDFRNLIKYDEEWLFKAVFNKQEEFDPQSDEYYKSKHKMARLDKVQLPFKI